tara:strand:+ start:100 stop:690 length:591 start_codon:yes stop_codon:yes gene_type:complete
MEVKLLNQNNLLVVLATLLGVRFALLPLMEWQGTAVDTLEASSRHLVKVQAVIANQPLYTQDLRVLRAGVTANDAMIYADTDSTKLVIQRDLERLFAQDGFVVTGFNWTLDSSDPDSSIRVLRVTIYFAGPTVGMIRAFWDISASSKVIKIIDWRQQIKSVGSDILGSTNGNVTLEFLAAKRNAVKSKQSLGGAGD